MPMTDFPKIALKTFMTVVAVTEISEGHIPEVSGPRGAESVCDLGRHAVVAAQRERNPAEGEIQTEFSKRQ